MKRVLKAIWNGIKEILIPIIWKIVQGFFLFGGGLWILCIIVILLLNPEISSSVLTDILMTSIPSVVIGTTINVFVLRCIEAQKYAEEMKCSFKEGWESTKTPSYSMEDDFQ